MGYCCARVCAAHDHKFGGGEIVVNMGEWSAFGFCVELWS